MPLHTPSHNSKKGIFTDKQIKRAGMRRKSFSPSIIQRVLNALGAPFRDLEQRRINRRRKTRSPKGRAVTRGRALRIIEREFERQRRR